MINLRYDRVPAVRYDGGSSDNAGWAIDLILVRTLPAMLREATLEIHVNRKPELTAPLAALYDGWREWHTARVDTLLSVAREWPRDQESTKKTIEIIRDLLDAIAAPPNRLAVPLMVARIDSLDLELSFAGPKMRYGNYAAKVYGIEIDLYGIASSEAH